MLKFVISGRAENNLEIFLQNFCFTKFYQHRSLHPRNRNCKVSRKIKRTLFRKLQTNKVDGALICSCASSFPVCVIYSMRPLLDRDDVLHGCGVEKFSVYMQSCSLTHERTIHRNHMRVCHNCSLMSRNLFPYNCLENTQF